MVLKIILFSLLGMFVGIVSVFMAQWAYKLIYSQNPYFAKVDEVSTCVDEGLAQSGITFTTKQRGELFSYLYNKIIEEKTKSYNEGYLKAKNKK